MRIRPIWWLATFLVGAVVWTGAILGARAVSAPATIGTPAAVEDLPGISASPDRVWKTTILVLRDVGIPVPPNVTWKYLPANAPEITPGELLGGLADPNTNVVEINRTLTYGDGRDLPVVFAHELGHLASYAAADRPANSAVEEAAAEAVARDLFPVIENRLRVDYARPTFAYHDQVTPLLRGTYRACRRAMPAARPARIEQCARRTRWEFLTANEDERTANLLRWGVEIPPLPPRPQLDEWLDAR